MVAVSLADYLYRGRDAALVELGESPHHRVITIAPATLVALPGTVPSLYTSASLRFRLVAHAGLVEGW